MNNTKFANMPDANGHFGIYGGRYVAETLMPALIEVERPIGRRRRIRRSMPSSVPCCGIMSDAPRRCISLRA